MHQLRSESTADWETASEKEFIGTMSIAQSWEDLSLVSEMVWSWCVGVGREPRSR